MKNKTPVLSICIPTYNREKYLKECIDSIINQEWFNEEEIEIVISDNASIDNTTEVVKSYQEKYTNIKYLKNEENIWAIKNILNLPNLANWEYVWFLSDDDMLSDIGIKSTLETIKKQKPDFILSNFFWFWNWKEIEYEKISKIWTTKNIIWINKFFDFLAETKYDITSYIMLLSIFCFKKELFTNNLNTLLKENWAEYIENIYKDNFLHSRIIYIPFWNEKKISIIEKDLVLCRWNNISWNFGFNVCRDLLNLINDLNKKYTINKIAYKKMKNVYYFSVFSYIIIAHIQKYLPKFLYTFFVYIWRNILKWIRKIKSII